MSATGNPEREYGNAQREGTPVTAWIRVCVAFAAPGAESLVELRLPAGATVADAAARSALIARHGLDPAAIAFAIFGQRAEPDTPLADGDRVELTRPLCVDPKQVRRERARARPLPKAAPRRKARPPAG
jgi:putative ubiquitin-RnfH superfamily antitoxin RatB of RatAB toxin-antitoxin module